MLIDPHPPQERVPFVVAERVPWEKMCDTLNLKFMAEVQTTKGLLKEHYFFLAQKIFNDHSATPEDFQSRSVSWAQFNKVRVGGAVLWGVGGCVGGSVWPWDPHSPPLPQEILPGRGFTFWQWFDGVLDLTKRCLKSYWSDRWVLGWSMGGSGGGSMSVCPSLDAVRLSAPIG